MTEPSDDLSMALVNLHANENRVATWLDLKPEQFMPNAWGNDMTRMVEECARFVVVHRNFLAISDQLEKDIRNPPLQIPQPFSRFNSTLKHLTTTTANHIAELSQLCIRSLSTFVGHYVVQRGSNAGFDGITIAGNKAEFAPRARERWASAIIKEAFVDRLARFHRVTVSHPTVDNFLQPRNYNICFPNGSSSEDNWELLQEEVTPFSDEETAAIAESTVLHMKI